MNKFLQKENGFNASSSDLKFGRNNGKLDDIITFSMPAGHSCPFAKDCRSCGTLKPRSENTRVSHPGKASGFGIQDGPHTVFRCFTAIDEVMRPAVRAARWHNYLTLLHTLTKGQKATVELIERSLPETKFSIPTRVHVSGDFFTQKYFDAWMEVARRHPDRLFYAYTKALPFWVARLGDIPNNFKLTASYGGTHDHLIIKHELKFVKVVTSPEEAAKMGLPVDHDDSHCYSGDKSFALVVHGQQPAGGIFAKAWSALKKRKMAGYRRTKGKTVTAGGGK